MGNLTNRELAILIWILPVLSFLVYHIDFRSLLIGVIKTFFHRKVTLIFVALFVYIGSSIWALWAIGFWELSLLKATILWAAGSGVAGIFEIAGRRDTRNFFESALRGQISVIVFVEYLATFQIFSLSTELILIPVSTILVIMLEFSAYDSEHQQVENFINVILSTLGVIILLSGITAVWSEVGEFFSIETLKDFLLPIILSLLILPFLYLLITLTVFETRFSGLRYQIEDKTLRQSAKRKAIWNFLFDLEGLNRWFQEVVISNIKSAEDLNTTFLRLKERRRIERTPPEIPLEEGWSPFKAMEFPENETLKSRHYQQCWEGSSSWYAHSDYFQLEKGVLRNQLSYQVEGSADVATRLSLNLDVQHKSGEKEALILLSETLRDISSYAGIKLSERVFETILMTEKGVFKADPATVRINRKDWPDEEAYDLTVDIEHRNHVSIF